MNEFSIIDFGAITNGKLQTEQIQQTIDYCYEQGGGRVVIPEGDFHTGGIRLRSNVCLYLMKDAHLIGSRNPEDYMEILSDKVQPLDKEDLDETLWLPVNKRKNYNHMNKPGNRWNNAIIRAVDAENASIVGEEGSYIDGCDCFDEKGEEYYRGPHAINMHRCSNITFENVHIKNSANWAFALFGCENVKAEKVKVSAGHDGIHITSCKNITINRCEFYTGDDCIAGIDNEIVRVSKCILNTACSAFRFGGWNIEIEDCEIFGPAKYLFRGSLSNEEKRNGTAPKSDGHRFNMLSLFTFYSDFSREIRRIPSDIKVKNCTVRNTDRFLHYNFSGNEPWQKNKPLKSIEFENVIATNVKNPVTAYGDEKCPISLTIKDSNIHFTDDRDNLPFIYLCNAEKVILKDTVVKNLKSDVLIKRWNDMGDIIFDNFVCEEFSGEKCVLTDEEFVCKAI